MAAACAALAVSRATVYRRRRAETCEEARPRSPSPRRLADGEREAVLDALHSDRFIDTAPAEVFATLLDEGVYLCSERTMYRILEAAAETGERRNQRKHPEYKKPELLATSPNEVWSWDITKLKGPAKWAYYHLYVIIDIYSRYVVGWMVASRESASLAERLILETCQKQGIERGELTIHADRGTSMNSKLVAQLLADLGVTKTHSRPHVSNDNPYSESHFKTMKYRPGFPQRFGSHEDARSYCRRFFDWYNNQHRHSGVAMLTPAQFHHGEGDEVIAARQETLDRLYAKHPERFVAGRSVAAAPPTAAWINPPADTEQTSPPSEKAQPAGRAAAPEEVI